MARWQIEEPQGGRQGRWRIDGPARDTRPSQLQAFASGAADSVSLGFGDELKGALAGAGAALSGEDYGRAYDDSVRGSRDRLEQARYWRPMSTLAGGLAGGVALGGVVGGGLRAARAATALSPLQRIGAAAGAGAGFGGVYGAGAADYGGAQERGMGALTGAGLGAAFGGALQGVGMGAGHLYRNMVRTAVPEERAAIELGKAFERSGQTPDTIRQNIGALREHAAANPSANPMLMDALGPAGPETAMVAATRQSAGRNALAADLEARNTSAPERLRELLWRELNGGQRSNAARSIDDLERIQKEQAAPLYAQAYQRTVNAVPEQLRQFVTFNSRQGARFNAAVNEARESLRRELGADVGDDVLMQTPKFWHRALENVQAEVGVAIRAARINPMGAPRGSAISDMAQDAHRFNVQVRRLLGPEFQRAQDIYAGAARNMDAVELGMSAVRADGELQLGQLARRIVRMKEGERQTARTAAISALSDAIAKADTGTGRANILRSIIGNDAKRRALQVIFGGEEGFQRAIRQLDTEQALFGNAVQTNIRVNSITADKYFGNQQMFGGNPTPGGLFSTVRQAIGREAKERFDEQQANAILQLLRTPLSSPAADDMLTEANRRGLLGRALREADRIRTFRRRVGPSSVVNGAVATIGDPQRQWGQ